MKLTFVNVGYGEAIIVDISDPSYEEGHFIMLIDGGPKLDSEFSDRSSGRIRIEEYLQKSEINHIDIAVLTHIHEDHLCGFYKAVSLYPPKEIWQTLPYDFGDTAGLCRLDSADTENCGDLFVSAMEDYCDMMRFVKSAGIKLVQKAAGEICFPCNGLSVSVLGPTCERETELLNSFRDTYASIHTGVFSDKFNSLDRNMNNFSLMLLLEYEGKRVFLPGDTNRDGYGDLKQQDIHADIFKIGHHGQKDGVSMEQLDRIRPSYVVCCASSTNKYNSAEAGLIQSIYDKGIEICFSDTPSVPCYTLPAHTVLEFSVSKEGITYLYK